MTTPTSDPSLATMPGHVPGCACPDCCGGGKLPDGGGLTAQLSLTLGKINDTQTRVCKQLDALAARAAALPNVVPLTRTGDVGVPGHVMLDFGQPQLGRFWMIRSFAISDAGFVRTSIAAGVTGDWFVSATTPRGSVDGVLPAQNWVWAQTTLPRIDLVSNEQIYVPSQQHLLCIIAGSNAGQIMQATAEIIDVSAASFASTFNV